MNGIQLTSMEASDMLDVIHYLFEDDLRVSTAEESDALTQMREVIYGQWYGYPYIFAGARSSSSKSNNKYNTASSFNDDFDLQPYDPNIKQPTKPYIPPTEFDADSGMPLSGNGLLEAPLN